MNIRKEYRQTYMPDHVWLRDQAGVGRMLVASKGHMRIAEFPASMNGGRMLTLREVQKLVHWR